MACEWSRGRDENAALTSIGYLSSLPEVAAEREVLFCPNCGIRFDKGSLEVNICPKCQLPLEMRVEISLPGLSSRFMGRRLLIPAVVAGEGPMKAVPIIFRAICEIRVLYKILRDEVCVLVFKVEHGRRVYRKCNG
jgi:hypothetical protein